MAANDFDNSPQAADRHEAATAATYLYFLRTVPSYFGRMWQELDETVRETVKRRLATAGATSEELEGLSNG